MPGTKYRWGKTAGEDKPRIYICERGACQAPTEGFEKARELIEAWKEFGL